MSDSQVAPARTAGASLDLLTIHEASATLPTRPAHATVFRWIVRGILGRDGVRVRLRAHRFGRQFFIDPADLRAFGVALAEASAERREPATAKRPAAPRSRSAERRAREVAKAKADLRARGLL